MTPNGYTRLDNERLRRILAEPRGGIMLRVYVALCMFADSSTGLAWPSQDTLAAECGISSRSVQTATAALRAAGHIEIRRRWINGKSLNEYQTRPEINAQESSGSNPKESAHCNAQESSGSNPKNGATNPKVLTSNPKNSSGPTRRNLRTNLTREPNQGTQPPEHAHANDANPPIIPPRYADPMIAQVDDPADLHPSVVYQHRPAAQAAWAALPPRHRKAPGHFNRSFAWAVHCHDIEPGDLAERTVAYFSSSEANRTSRYVKTPANWIAALGFLEPREAWGDNGASADTLATIAAGHVARSNRTGPPRSRLGANA
jgi:biotin operon repressor